MMNSTLQRPFLLPLIEQAIADGARLQQASTQIGLDARVRTVQRLSSTRVPKMVTGVSSLRVPTISPDRSLKLSATPPCPCINSEEFKDLPPGPSLPPSQTASLADQGQYVASEATMYRLLHSAYQMDHRHRSLERVLAKSASRAHCATPARSNQLLGHHYPAPVRGMHFYLYLSTCGWDIFSRKIVGGTAVLIVKAAELAAGLLRDICERQGIPEGQLTVHSDNGSPMKARPCSRQCSAWV